MISTARTPRNQSRIDDPLHQVAGPFIAPTASGTSTPEQLLSPVTAPPSPRRGPAPPTPVSPLLRWAVSPLAAALLLAAPPLLALPTHFLLPRLPPGLRPRTNPFAACFRLSHALPAPPHDPRGSTAAPGADVTLYAKGYGDLALLAYTVVLFSFLRLVLSHYAFPALARSRGITKKTKLLRFGEQGYAVVYFAVFGAWGVYVMSQSRTWWFRTEFFWRDYPHAALSGAMKRYYLSQIAYWLQQFLVLTLGLEKRRSDHWELVLHHCITVWMVSWSYLMNVTLLGNAVFMSMDVPDLCLAFSKLLNYLQLERAKVVSLGVFVVVWTYFRHYISIRILYSLRYEFHLVPEHARQWNPRAGAWMALWMRDQMFYTLCVLQALNLFWYYLIIRVVVRSIMTAQTDDNRSDDEEDGDEEDADADIDADVDAEPKEKKLPPSVSGRAKRGSADKAIMPLVDAEADGRGKDE